MNTSIRPNPPKNYSPLEEKLNIVSHAIGCLLSLVALVVLIARANQLGTIWHMISFGIFGLSMLVLYASSTSYHSATKPTLRFRLKIIDHCAIYILIAGTYTPFTLITLGGAVGWTIFGVVWSFAVAGVIFKLFFTGKYNKLSTLMYVMMGWIIIFAIQPLMNSLPTMGLLWLFIGGLLYTVGAVFFSLDKIKFNHAIFHLFVLGGSFCHFMSVFFYVLPNPQ